MIHEEMEIWQKGEYIGADKNFTPKLSTYILTGGDKKGAILILPGGAYQFTSWCESEPVAVWANSIGYHAFVLNYSVNPNKHPQPLLDVTRAMCIIRDNAKRWNLEDNKIAVCGFSAGGHLAASLGVYWRAPFLQGIAGMRKGKNKPNAMVLCYPVITSGDKAHRGSFDNLLGENASQQLMNEVSLEKHVSSDTPPAFVWSTFNDELVPVENSFLFVASMREINIPFELHIFPNGVHGLSLSTKETWRDNPDFVNSRTAEWTNLCEKWLKNIL